MANDVAYLAILGWPVIVFALFRALPMAMAIAVAVVAGYLFLPSSPGFNLPLLPPWNKETATTVPVIVMALWAAGRPGRVPAGYEGPLPGLLPRDAILLTCVILLVAQPAVTAFMNGNDLVFPTRRLKGLTLYDGASQAMLAGVAFLPFLIGRRWLYHPRHHVVLLTVLAGAGVIYAVLSLYELRMSPQLNSNLYGFFPHSWRQHLRDGGYRPIIFLNHGLKVAIFLAVATLAAVVAARAGPKNKRWLFAGAAVFIFATLFLTKNLGAFLITMVMLPVLLFLGQRTRLIVVACIAGSILVFPMLRSSGVLSSSGIVSTLSTVAPPERLASLGFRLRNEEMLLEKANQRPFFGWGGWGRARVFDEEGNDLSVTDGSWVIAFGEGGWVGYVGEFGLLLLPVLLLAYRKRHEVDPATIGIAVVLTANLVDLIPNSGLSSVTWLLAGALAGRIEWTESTETAAEEPPSGTARARDLPYARPGPATLPGGAVRPAVSGPDRGAPVGPRVGPRVGPGRAKRPEPRYTRYTPAGGKH